MHIDSATGARIKVIEIQIVTEPVWCSSAYSRGYSAGCGRGDGDGWGNSSGNGRGHGAGRGHY